MDDWLNKCHFGDVRDVLKRMIADGVKVQTIVTSPPYWGLRSYLPAEHADKASEIGSEPTLRGFLDNMVSVFALARQVLAEDGTLWLNLGDTYRDKCQQMVPARSAIALVDEGGWIQRNEIIWAKKNLTPQSVDDRCTHAHEQIYLFAKSTSYYCDMAAIREPSVWDTDGTGTAARKARADESHKAMPGELKTGIRPSKKRGEFGGKHADRPGQEAFRAVVGMRNKRSVWSVATTPYAGAHFATFPPSLIEPCILAGAPAGGTVLDIFMGSGTTAQVAEQLGRQWIGIDLDTRNKALQDERLRQPSLALEAA